MARLMFSCGMFSAFAARIAVRSRELPSGSPPPAFAAMVISLIRRVNVLPRLASSAPFLCLIVAHFEWPDMGTSVSSEMLACPSGYAPLQAPAPASIPPGRLPLRPRRPPLPELRNAGHPSPEPSRFLNKATSKPPTSYKQIQQRKVVPRLSAFSDNDQERL